MRKLSSYTLTFVIGFVICGIVVQLTHGDLPFSKAGEGKDVVLARLQAPTSVHERVGNESIITKAAATIEPSIVTIDVETKAVAVQSPFSNDPFFRHFFGDQMPQAQPQKGVGSGVIISEDGYILTNNHVVKNAANVKVVLSDGKAYRAKVIGADRSSDIAVVKIDAPDERLRAAQFGDSKALQVGDMVIAAGNPLNIGTTVTFGIVSALGHRNSDVTGGPQPLASDIIQTDAAINPGNSGGALADMDGHVVGINEAIISPTGSYVGIGLAIPINTAKDIAYQLIKDGKVIRPYVGVAYIPLKGVATADRAQVGIVAEGDKGVVITNVYAGSPAEEAGLKPYDVVLDANGQSLSDTVTLQGVISKLKVGDRLVLRVDRRGETKLVSIKVAEMPAQFGEQPQQSDDQGDNTP